MFFFTLESPTIEKTLDCAMMHQERRIDRKISFSVIFVECCAWFIVFIFPLTRLIFTPRYRDVRKMKSVACYSNIEYKGTLNN